MLAFHEGTRKPQGVICAASRALGAFPSLQTRSSRGDETSNDHRLQTTSIEREGDDVITALELERRVTARTDDDVLLAVD